MSTPPSRLEQAAQQSCVVTAAPRGTGAVTPTPFEFHHNGVTLTGEHAGAGPDVVLLHGLTATRRYVVMGSNRLERSGHHVIAYDARGHGHSGAAPTTDAYTYELLAADLAAVLDSLQIQRATLAGASMGAQTALRFALDHPTRVAALVLITPAYDPSASSEPAAYAHWDALASGLREGGVEGFVSAYDLDSVPPRFRDTVTKVLRQRLAAHSHPLAVADALEATPRSRPFADWGDLSEITAPCLVIASRDEPDPGHPLAIAERYAAAIPGAQLALEQPDESPLAWRGGQLSQLIAEMVSGRTVADAG